jgi:hypothetical protein
VNSDPYKLAGFVSPTDIISIPNREKLKSPALLVPGRMKQKRKIISWNCSRVVSIRGLNKHWKWTRIWQTSLGCRNRIRVGIHYLRRWNERTTLRIWILDLLLCVCALAFLACNAECRERIREGSGSLADRVESKSEVCSNLMMGTSPVYGWGEPNARDGTR